MRVLLSESLFEAKDLNPLDLLAIFNLGAEGRHNVLTEPVDSAIVTNWLNAQSLQIREWCQLALDGGYKSDAFLSSRKEIRVVASGGSDWTSRIPVLPLAEARILLYQPFRVLVENNVNDRNFLISSIPTEWRKKLQESEANGWIEFEHGGGSTLRAQLVTRLADPGKSARTFTFFDSDALRLGSPSPVQVELQSLCGTAIKHHMLLRRSIENYLPQDALTRWAAVSPPATRDEKKRRVRAFFRLRPEQRNHFNVREGFRGDAAHARLATRGDLFADVPHGDQVVLENGFGAIAVLFDIAKYPAVSEGIMDADHCQEVKHLAEQIVNLA